MDQLLWIETLIKGAIGICLLLSPKMTIRLLALPETSTAFWPRLTGGLLVGLAAVIFASGAKLISDGIGLGGLAALNLSAAMVLFGTYWRWRPTPRRRGRALLGGLGVALCLLALLELLVR